MLSFKIPLLTFLFVILDKSHASFITNFDSNSPTLLIANKLPLTADNQAIEFKVMPYVGNGHLASTIFDKTIYVNGLYNGDRGNSHRASLPNIHNFNITSSNGGFTYKQYVLNLKEGIYKTEKAGNFELCDRYNFFLKQESLWNNWKTKL